MLELKRPFSWSPNSTWCASKSNQLRPIHWTVTCLSSQPTVGVTPHYWIFIFSVLYNPKILYLTPHLLRSDPPGRSLVLNLLSSPGKLIPHNSVYHSNKIKINKTHVIPITPMLLFIRGGTQQFKHSTVSTYNKLRYEYKRYTSWITRFRPWEIKL